MAELSIKAQLAKLRGIESDMEELSNSLTAAPVKPVGTSSATTVFISWAHAHRTWTAEQASAWEADIARVAATLRIMGIDADVDLFHIDEAVDWTRYGPSRVQSVDVVLVVMSQSWAERWEGNNDPREGAGAAAEADTLHGLFNQNQESWQKRIVVVMLSSNDRPAVPPGLERLPRVALDADNPSSYMNLLRLLTKQPRYVAPKLGNTPKLATVGGIQSTSSVQELRWRLENVSAAAKDASTAAEKQQLLIEESALRGFIEAILEQ